MISMMKDELLYRVYELKNTKQGLYPYREVDKKITAEDKYLLDTKNIADSWKYLPKSYSITHVNKNNPTGKPHHPYQGVFLLENSKINWILTAKEKGRLDFSLWVYAYHEWHMKENGSFDVLEVDTTIGIGWIANAENKPQRSFIEIKSEINMTIEFYRDFMYWKP